MTEDLLGQLAGRAPRRLLEDLAVLGRALAGSDRARPEVEVYLTGGAVIRGRVLDVADDRNGPVVVVQVGTASASFVRIDQIAAVTVVEASLLVRSAVSDAPAPSRLELQRQLVTRTETLTGKLPRGLSLALAGDLDDDGRRAVAVLLPVLGDVLTAIARDTTGVEALASIDGLEIGAATTGEVSRPDPSKLVIHAPKAATEAFTVASLRAAIEKLL